MSTSYSFITYVTVELETNNKLRTDPAQHAVQGKRDHAGGGMGRVRRDPLHEEQGEGSRVGGNHHIAA